MNKTFSKSIILVSIIVIVCILLSSCSTSCPIDNYTKAMLQTLDINQSQIIRLGDLPQKTYNSEVTVTEKEITEYLSDILDSDKPYTVISDDFVKENTEYDTVNEYLEYVKIYLYMAKQNEQYMEHKKEFLDEIIQNSTFDILDDEVIIYSVYIAESYENLAKSFNMTLQEYYKTNGMTKDEFFSLCYNEALYEIKQYLVIGALIEKNSINVTNSELQKEYERYGYDDEYISENPEKIVYINYHYIETKTLQTLLYGFTITTLTTTENGGK